MRVGVLNNSAYLHHFVAFCEGSYLVDISFIPAIIGNFIFLAVLPYKKQQVTIIITKRRLMIHFEMFCF